MEPSSLYKNVIRPALFCLPPETIHDLTLALGAPLARNKLGFQCLRKIFGCCDARLEVKLFDLVFPNPFGLAAGFDKNCRAVPLMAALGFGHIEVGTITSQAQAGNPKPRIFRLPADRALINRMGFPGDGVKEVAPRLAQLRQQPLPIIVGVNIGKTKVVPVDDALQDYLETFRAVKDAGDYFVLNVSSPNTPELRKLQEAKRLEQLFRGVDELNRLRRPLLVKIAPDLSWQQIDEVLQCCETAKISGLIATNTTLGRDGLSCPSSENGGLSGPPLREKARKIVSYIYRQSAGRIPIIGVGGISSSRDAIEMLKAGASLVQVYTGLIYEGPRLVKMLSQGLLRCLEQEGYKSVKELVGSGAK